MWLPVGSLTLISSQTSPQALNFSCSPVKLLEYAMFSQAPSCAAHGADFHVQIAHSPFFLQLLLLMLYESPPPGQASSPGDHPSTVYKALEGKVARNGKFHCKELLQCYGIFASSLGEERKEGGASPSRPLCA